MADAHEDEETVIEEEYKVCSMQMKVNKARKEINYTKIKCIEFRTLQIGMKVIETRTKVFVPKRMKADLGK